MMSHWNLPKKVAVSIQPDSDGFMGRECPQGECKGYFKIAPGTGLKGDNLPLHCPYCGHTAALDHFATEAQVEYAKSVAFREFNNAFLRELKSLEFNHRPSGPLGIGFSMKVKPGIPPPIRYYRERELETVIVCERCTLRYAIYGVFAYCPDCGTHNSKQILDSNLALAEKQASLANTVEKELAVHLIYDAMENVVSAFDGFGRETCRVRSSQSTAPAQAMNVSFQNLDGAKQRMQTLFGVDLATAVTPDEWSFASKCFHKRHLLAHKMGVVDESYVNATSDAQAVIGRKVSIDNQEVIRLISIAKRLGNFLVSVLPKPPV